MAFRDRLEAREYIERYCGDVKGWADCSIAKSVIGCYARKDKDDQRCQ